MSIDLTRFGLALVSFLSATSPSLATPPGSDLVSTRTGLHSTTLASGFAQHVNHFETGMRHAVREARPFDCFGSKLGTSESDRRIALSTVFLMATSQSGNLTELGTGTVVADSKEGGGHNRIVSVKHVAYPKFDNGETSAKPGTVDVYASDGSRLGSAKVIGMEHAQTSDLTESTTREAAVLRMYDHDTAPAFDQIPGVPLSPMISDRILTGMASGPGGFNPGVSGGGTYDNQGRLLAAMSAIQLIGIGSVGKSVDVPATSIYDATTAWQQGQNMTSWFMANADHQRLNVFSTDRGVMAPLGQPEILGLLGNAGRNSTAAPADVPDHVDARLVGFPNGKCAVYTASLEAYDPHNPLHQISIDRKDVLGPTDPVRPNGVRIGKDGMIIAYDDRGKVHLVVMPDGSRREFDNGVPIARGLASPEEPAAAQGPR